MFKFKNSKLLKDNKLVVKKINTLALLSVGTLLSVTTISAASTNSQVKSFGAGKGHEITKSHYFAPYVDLSDWISSAEYGDHGAANLNKLATESKADYLNVGFIQPLPGASKNTDGSLKWGVGSFSTLNEDHKNNEQYKGMKRQIKKLRDNNKDIILSFGGNSGSPFWMVSQDEKTLYKTYKNIIQGFDAKTIDLDVEGSAQGPAENRANARALKKLQDETGLKINITLPVMPTGLTTIGEGALKAYIESGVKLSKVNIMTMCYGESGAPKGYRQGSIDAVKNTKNQLIKDYKEVGVTLSNTQAYSLIGTTPSVGFEGTNHPIWTVEDQKAITKDAIDKKIGMLSYWVMNRDARIGGYKTNKGIKGKYEFANASNSFSNSVTGTVSIPTITKTKLTELTTTAKKKEIKEQDDISKVSPYNAKNTYKKKGMLVSYKLNTFKAKWWINSGTKPDINDRFGAKTGWELVSGPELSRTPIWNSSASYPGHTIVEYKGKEYTNKWWANAGNEPTKHSVWVLSSIKKSR